MIRVYVSTGETFEISIGEPKPNIKNKIIRLDADDKELALIKSKFSNLPFPNHKKLVMWKHDFAQFIFDNL